MYHVENMFIPHMTAGPKEPTADKLQFNLKQIVDKLILLYTRGIIIKTRLHPNGTRSATCFANVIYVLPQQVKLSNISALESYTTTLQLSRCVVSETMNMH
jgi:hypothetical protein